MRRPWCTISGQKSGLCGVRVVLILPLPLSKISMHRTARRTPVSALVALFLMSEVVAIRPRMSIPSGSVQFVLDKHLFPYMPEGWAVRDDDEGTSRDDAGQDRSELGAPATVRGAARSLPSIARHGDTAVVLGATAVAYPIRPAGRVRQLVRR